MILTDRKIYDFKMMNFIYQKVFPNRRPQIKQRYFIYVFE